MELKSGRDLGNRVFVMKRVICVAAITMLKYTTRSCGCLGVSGKSLIPSGFRGSPALLGDSSVSFPLVIVKVHASSLARCL